MILFASGSLRRNRLLFVSVAALAIVAMVTLTCVLVYRWIDRQVCSDPVYLSYDGGWRVSRYYLEDNEWRTWKSPPSSRPRLRASHAIGPRAVVVLDSERSFAGWMFDLNFRRWSKIPPSPVAGGNVAGAIQTEFVANRLVFWGRTTGPPHGAVLDIKSRRWTPMPEAPITLRYCAACGVIGSKLYIWGGYGFYSGSSGSSGPVSDGAVFDVDRNEWELLPESPISMGYETRLRVWRDKIILLDKSDTAIYDPPTRTCERLPDSPFDRCSMPAWAVVGDHIFVWSGHDGARGTTPQAERAAAYDLITRLRW